MTEGLKSLIKARLDELNINPFEAARNGGLERSYINDILIGKKLSIRDDKKAQVAAALGLSISELMRIPITRRMVPILGYASAGSDEIRFDEAQGPFDEVEAPAGATQTTVAVIIRGTSLGTLLDGWVAFYDERRDPPDDSLLGEVCVCGLSNGRVVIKKLRRGSRHNLYHLESAIEGTMFDQAVEWAAKVRAFHPYSAPTRVEPKPQLKRPVSHVGKRRTDR